MKSNKEVKFLSLKNLVNRVYHYLLDTMIQFLLSFKIWLVKKRGTCTVASKWLHIISTCKMTLWNNTKLYYILIKPTINVLLSMSKLLFIWTIIRFHSRCPCNDQIMWASTMTFVEPISMKDTFPTNSSPNQTFPLPTQ